jgi:hypothetical protein
VDIDTPGLFGLFEGDKGDYIRKTQDLFEALL